jgi:serine/threonine-protein kinase
MRVCPKCRTTYPRGGASTCKKDGTKLVDAKEFAAAQADPLLGTTIGGRFEIIDRVGTGGMGTVYRAKQAGLDRHVALKILKKELNWDKDTVTRFHREAKAMSLLTHPNTVRVFDFGETPEGMLYFAMELLEGELLTAKVDREGALDPVDAIRITQQILRSLSEAHSKGIIHRDLKPDNIFLVKVEGQPEAVVKVLDFGIAKVVQTERQLDQLETQAGTVFGTPRYMSPEQAQGRQLDPRSDLYSVGVLLYHMLTGHPPFVDDDAVVVMAKHIREKAPSPRVAAPDRPIPGTLDRVVQRAMEKEPSKRPKTAEQLDRRLEACILDVHHEKKLRAEGGGGASLLGSLPRVPLAIGAMVIAAAFGIAAYVVASSGEASAGAESTFSSAPDATPAARPPSDEGAAEVRITSEPSGAEIWFEGELLGATPLSVLRPAGSTTRVELRRDGYLTAFAELRAGEPRHVELTTRGDSTTPGTTSTHVAETARPRVRRRGAMRRTSSETTSSTATMVEVAAPSMMSSEEPYEMW